MAFPKAASLVAGVCILMASGFAACAEEKFEALICKVDYLADPMGTLEFTVGGFDELGKTARYNSDRPGSESELYPLTELPIEGDES